MAKKRIDDQLLIDAALSEFSQYSFEDSSVNRIIERAGITKGSFYYRFPNKYDLYLHLLRQANREKWEYIKEDILTPSAETRDIFDLFRRQAESGVRFALARPDYHRLSKMFSKEKNTPVYRQVVNDLNATDEPGMKQLIARFRTRSPET